jgi:hypothetical protein
VVSPIVSFAPTGLPSAYLVAPRNASESCGAVTAPPARLSRVNLKSVQIAAESAK